MELSVALPSYLAKQRWYPSTEPPDELAIVHEELFGDVQWLIVEADGSRYQLLLDARTNDIVDALHDTELAKTVLSHVSDETASVARPMGVEQSNTSVVFDERIILKVFRRLQEGPNPDIEVTASLARAGFANVAEPIAVWTHAGTDLGVVQPFLAGAAEGWSLALTSLRDLYANQCSPDECGGDFAFEAGRLGEVTAQMHLAMAAAFGTEEPDGDMWRKTMLEQLERIAFDAPWADEARTIFNEDAIGDGKAIRVHGDYHLGQVLRTDTGWFVLDFEGEPARPLDERRRPASPLKDVAGMLRSFQYAAAVTLRDHPDEEWDRLQPFADAWERRNREAFLRGYLATEGIESLLPAPVIPALAAWELDKAVYEVGYERGHRPDWVSIPESAIARVLTG